MHGDNPRLVFAKSPDRAAECDLFCIAVPTPVRVDAGKAGIDLSYLEAAVATVAGLAKPGAAIVVESSVAVGTTRRMLRPLRERGMFVGFSPERVDPGRTDPPAHAIPKVLAAMDEASMDRIGDLYGAVFDKVVPVSTLETAEMSKLFENCFRLVNIAYANEIADACGAHGIDPHEMVRACATKPYGYMAFTPGLGAGGPCIPVNPHYLLVNNELPLLESAMKKNADRPAARAQALFTKHPAAARVLVSGVGFKPGQALTVHSPGLSLAHALGQLGLTVTVHDPLACAGKDQVEGLAVLPSESWMASTLSSAFDLVCVAMPQDGVDFGVLYDAADVAVEWMCAPPAPATTVSNVDPAFPACTADGISQKKTVEGEESRSKADTPIQIHVSAVQT